MSDITLESLAAAVDDLQRQLTTLQDLVLDNTVRAEHVNALNDRIAALELAAAANAGTGACIDHNAPAADAMDTGADVPSAPRAWAPDVLQRAGIVGGMSAEEIDARCAAVDPGTSAA